MIFRGEFKKNVLTMKKEAASCHVTSIKFYQSTWRHIPDDLNVRDTSAPRLNMGMIIGVPALSACSARYGTAVTLQMQKYVLCAFTV